MIETKTGNYDGRQLGRLRQSRASFDEHPAALRDAKDELVSSTFAAVDDETWTGLTVDHGGRTIMVTPPQCATSSGIS